MTLQLELEPQDLQVLEARAAALGVPIERAALQVLVIGLHSMPSDFARSSETMAALYAHSLATGGELTAFSNAQEDIYEYSASDLAAMERGEFERPLR